MRENGKNDLAPHFVDNKIVDKKNSKKILLVDDVVTTGWTVAQVSQSLAQMVHKGGHQFEMHVLALASGLSGPIE